MQSVLLDLQKELHKTIVFMTHDVDEALRLGDRIAILRDGEVIQEGTGQDIVMEPADEYTQNFVKAVNRTLVIMTESVMQAGPAANAQVSVGVSDNLQDAARAMSDARQQVVNVTNRDGHVVGHLDLDTTVPAIVKQESRHTTPVSEFTE